MWSIVMFGRLLSQGVCMCFFWVYSNYLCNVEAKVALPGLVTIILRYDQSWCLADLCLKVHVCVILSLQLLRLQCWSKRCFTTRTCDSIYVKSFVSTGSCECFPGFTATDCSLDLSNEVVIEGITGDGICDIHNSDCSCIRLTTSGSLETSKYKLVHREVTCITGWCCDFAKETLFYILELLQKKYFSRYLCSHWYNVYTTWWV